MLRLRLILLIFFLVAPHGFADPTAQKSGVSSPPQTCVRALRGEDPLSLVDPSFARARKIGWALGWTRWKPSSNELHDLAEYEAIVENWLLELTRAPDYKTSSQMPPTSLTEFILVQMGRAHHRFLPECRQSRQFVRYDLAHAESVRARLFVLVLENIRYLRTRPFLTERGARLIYNDTGDMLHFLGHFYEEFAFDRKIEAYWDTAYLLHHASLSFYDRADIAESPAINHLNGVEHAIHHVHTLLEEHPGRAWAKPSLVSFD